MKLRFGGPFPFHVDLNPLMAWGVGVVLVGAAGGLAGYLGLYPRDSPLWTASFGTALFGMALYLLGRIVQFVRLWRDR